MAKRTQQDGKDEKAGKRVTLKTVAEHLGLSPATISVVLNDSPVADSIPAETKKRVFAAAKKLNYRPNYLARSLRGKRSFSIGVLVPEISEGYAAGLMGGVEDHLVREGYFYLIASYRSKPDLLAEYLKHLEDRSVEGFIVVAAQLTEAPTLPTVVLSGHQRLEGVTNVVADQDKAASLALCHLKQLGHQRIAFFRGAEGNADADDRWRAIGETAEALDLEIAPELALRLVGKSYGAVSSPEEGYHEGYSYGQKLLATTRKGQRPDFTALFAFNDVSAIGAMRAFLDAGLRVPEDVSVVGFDDILSAAFHNPSLTTVRQPLQKMGETAGRILLERLAGKNSHPDFVTVEPELVVRASTGPARSHLSSAETPAPEARPGAASLQPPRSKSSRADGSRAAGADAPDRRPSMKIAPRLGFGAILAAVIGAGSVAPLVASPQRGANDKPTPDAEAPAFGETVDVQLVNVEVWVTDRQGNPITGLDAGDFEVREDGKVVEVSNFAEIRDSPLGDPFAPTAPIEAPVEGTVAQQPLDLQDLLEEPQPVPGAGFLALYFDELFSRPAGRKRLIRDLRTFIELRRVPHERVLILRQDKGLKVEANLGSSRAELEAALDRLETPSSRGIQTWADERNAFRRLQEEWELEVVAKANGRRDPCEWFPKKAFHLIQFHINSSRTRIGETLEHLTDTAGFLAGLPGPKTLIYVSDGLALAPGKDLLSFAKSLCLGRQDDQRLDYLDGMGEAFRTLSRHANANRVTIYSIQALGLRSHLTATSASERGSKRTIQALSRYNSESRMQQQEGMSYLAEQTGGRAVFNRGTFIEELEQIAEDMTGFYSLAYAPTHGGDGLEHKIEVKVRGDKLRVRHRPGYRDKSQDQRLIERLQSALYLNLMANPLGVSLGAGEITAGDKGKLKVPLHVRIPADKITFLPQQGGDFAGLKVLVMSRDERQSKTAFKHESYRLARPAESDLTVSLVIDLELPAGIHVIAFGIRDESTREASFVATGVDIQPPPDGPAAAGP